jgi:hypothetical protein
MNPNNKNNNVKNTSINNVINISAEDITAPPTVENTMTAVNTNTDVAVVKETIISRIGESLQNIKISIISTASFIVRSVKNAASFIVGSVKNAASFIVGKIKGYWSAIPQMTQVLLVDTVSCLFVLGTFILMLKTAPLLTGLFIISAMVYAVIKIWWIVSEYLSYKLCGYKDVRDALLAYFA